MSSVKWFVSLCTVTFVTLNFTDARIVSGYREIRLLIGEGKYAQAMIACKEMVKANPDSPPLYEALVDASYYGNALLDATSFFHSLARDGSRPDLAYYGAGLVQYCERNFKMAVLLFERAIALGCEYPDCYKMLEYSYEKASGEAAATRVFSILSSKNPDNANNWYGLALAHWDKKDGSTILRCLNEALRRRPGEARYQQAIAAAMSVYGDERRAEATIEELLAISLSESDYQGYFFLQAYKVQLSAKMGRESGSNTAMDDLAEFANKIGFHRWEGWCYLKQADIEFEIGAFRKSIKSGTKARHASEIAHDSDLEVACLGRLFESHLALGNIGEAIDAALIRLRYLDKGGTQRQIVKALLDMGRAYHEIGKFDLSLDYLTEALARTVTIEKDTILQIELRSAMGLAYKGQGKSAEAMRSFKLALSLLPSRRVWPHIKAQVSGEIGRCLLLMRDYREAIQYFSAQRALVKANNLLRIEPEVHANLGDYYFARGQIMKASGFYEKALSKSRVLHLQRLVNRSLRGIAHTKSILGDTFGALRAYSDLLGDEVGQVGSHIDAVLVLGTDGEIRSDIEEYVRLLLKVSDAKKAFAISEFLKLHEAADPFSLPLCKVNDSRFDSLIIHARDIRRRFGRLHTDLSNSSRDSPFEEGLLRNIALRSQIAETEIEYGRLLNAISRTSQVFRERLLPLQIRLVSLQHFLGETNTAVVEYLVGRKSTIAFVITVDTLSAFEVKVSADSLNVTLSSLTPLLDAKKDMEGIWNPILASFDSSIALKLFRLLLRPAMPIIQNVSRLTIVPDESIRNLPFEILKCESIEGVKDRGIGSSLFLVERFEINYALAASFITGKATSVPVRRILAIGSDLVNGPEVGSNDSKLDLIDPFTKQAERSLFPGVRNEKGRIQKVIGLDRVYAPGREYRKHDFINSVKAFELIHIASHSIWNQKNPSISSLHLNEDRHRFGEGVLMSYELADLDLHSRILVLSACNSARWSKEARSYGFLKGSFGADAISIVGAVWPIDDEATSDLMETFYGFMKEGMRVGRALQLAKIKLMRSGKHDPFYWGGFILVGPSVSIQWVDSEKAESERATLFGFAFALIVFSVAWYLQFKSGQVKEVETGSLT